MSALALGAAPEVGPAGLPLGAFGLAKGAEALGDLAEGGRFLNASKRFGRTGLPELPQGDESDNGRKNGGHITAKQRNALPKSEFAEPKERKYPIDTRARAANAKARVSQFGTPAEKAKVDTAVKRKYPTMGKD